MTSKQAVCLAVRSGRYNLEALRREYRGIQVRKVGKETVQIRFRDGEAWMTPEDFADNYVSKTIKDLNDQWNAAEVILTENELCSAIPKAVLSIMRPDEDMDTFSDRQMRHAIHNQEKQIEDLKNKNESLRQKAKELQKLVFEAVDEVHKREDRIKELEASLNL
jgi:hypothetical protein